jgi:histidyl-tRNA synthetase
MSLPTQPYKGARDFYPADKRLQKYMFNTLRRVVESFGYQEYDAPIIEPLEMFLAKTGEEIVNDQLYSFTDRGKRQVALRPEMTPSVSRMVAARRQELPYPLRWYSIPNLWRYERPQRGRLREHWQLNVDIFGVAGIEADHEIILVADAIMKAFGAPKDSYTIRLSSRQLVDHFFKDYMKLSDKQFYETSKLIDRWHKIERGDFQAQAKEILSENKQYKELLELLESKSLESLPETVKKSSAAKELHKLVELLKASGVDSAEFDFSVIRGMDYYDNVVFEVFDTNPENTRSMFGGGRYNGLVGLFGVEPVPTVGFGMGDVTLQNFLELHKLLPELPVETDAVAILIGEVYKAAQAPLSELRLAGVRVAIDGSGRKLDAQLRSAVKSGVPYVIFIGEKELSSGQYKLKNLHSGEEHQLSLEQVASTLRVRHQDA